MKRRNALRWLLAAGLLGSTVCGKLWAPQGYAALQQLVFGQSSGALETAISVFAAGGSLGEVIACASAVD